MQRTRSIECAAVAAVLAVVALVLVPTTASASPPPSVVDVSLRRGPVGGGSTVQISGSGLADATAVRFGATTPATSFTVVSDALVLAVVPPHAPGLVNVFVDTAGGTNPNQASSWYLYLAPPVVRGVSPNAGPVAGGRQVTVTGTGLRYASSVRFGPSPGGDAAFEVLDDTTLVATTPLANPDGVVNVWVETPGGTNLNRPSSWYRFVAPPSVTAVTPNRGPTSGGDAVVIEGGPFTDVVGVAFGQSCWFAICRPRPATSFTVDSESQITAMAPPRSAGVDCVKVESALGGWSRGSWGCFYAWE